MPNFSSFLMFYTHYQSSKMFPRVCRPLSINEPSTNADHISFVCRLNLNGIYASLNLTLKMFVSPLIVEEYFSNFGIITWHNAGILSC